MSRKQWRIVIESTLGAIIVIFLFVIIGLKFFPSLFGVRMVDNSKNENLYEPVVNISQKKLDYYQNALLNASLIKSEKDYLWSFKNTLIDSISKLLDSIHKTQIIYNKISDSIEKSRLSQNFFTDSIGKLQLMYKSLQLENIKLSELISGPTQPVTKSMDSLKRSNLSEFAQIYNNSNPADIAKILENIDVKVAAIILKNMQKKKAGKVIEAMKPERSASILINGIGN